MPAFRFERMTKSPSMLLKYTVDKIDNMIKVSMYTPIATAIDNGLSSQMESEVDIVSSGIHLTKFTLAKYEEYDSIGLNKGDPTLSKYYFTEDYFPQVIEDKNNEWNNVTFEFKLKTPVVVVSSIRP
jgi:hypothetical protein